MVNLYLLRRPRVDNSFTFKTDVVCTLKTLNQSQQPQSLTYPIRSGQKVRNMGFLFFQPERSSCTSKSWMSAKKEAPATKQHNLIKLKKLKIVLEKKMKKLIIALTALFWLALVPAASADYTVYLPIINKAEVINITLPVGEINYFAYNGTSTVASFGGTYDGKSSQLTWQVLEGNVVIASGTVEARVPYQGANFRVFNFTYTTLALSDVVKNYTMKISAPSGATASKNFSVSWHPAGCQPGRPGCGGCDPNNPDCCSRCLQKEAKKE